MKTIRLALLLAALTISKLSLAQDTSIPEWILKNWEYRVQNNGIWIADNAKYKSENEPFEAYGIKWEWGLGNKSIRGRLYCIKDGVDVWSAWHFVDYWDPAAKEVKVLQIGADGTVGLGNMWQEKDGTIKSLQTFTSPDGTSSVSGHESRDEPGVQYSQSFDVINDEWQPRRSYVWKNVANPKK